MNQDAYYEAKRSRILHSRRPSVAPTCISLSKMDVKNAFQQIPVEWGHRPLFGYASAVIRS